MSIKLNSDFGPGDVLMVKIKSTFDQPSNHLCYRPVLVLGQGDEFDSIRIAVGDSDRIFLNHPMGFTILPAHKMEEAGIQLPTTFNLAEPIDLFTALWPPVQHSNTIVQIGRLSDVDINRLKLKIALVKHREAFSDHQLATAA